MRFDMARLFVWAIPLVCIALAAVVLFREQTAFAQAGQNLQTAQVAESSASLVKEKAEQVSGSNRFAAVPLSPNEEPEFLNDLRARAAARSPGRET